MVTQPLGDALTFDLRDDFTVALGGPLPSPRDAEPGPGAWTIVDTERKQYITGGEFIVTGGRATPNFGDPRVQGSASLARGIGRASFTKFRDSSGLFEVGWTNSSGARFVTAGMQVFGTSIRPWFGAGNTQVDTGLVIVGETVLVTSLRSVGSFNFARIGGVWSVAGIDNAGSAPTFYVGFDNNNGAVKYDYFRVRDLPAPFSTDFGLATQRLAGSVAQGTTFTHEANFIGEFTVTTLPSTGYADVIFRRVDASNYWNVHFTTNGEFSLWEIVAGVGTQRAIVPTIIVAGHRVVIVADGPVIRGYSNNVLRWTYSNATNFVTATAGSVLLLMGSSVLSDLITWPRVLSAPYAAILDDAANGTAGGYLLNDEFITPAGGPLPSPRQADVGMVKVIDTGNNLSISNGQARASVAAGVMNPALESLVTYPREVGRAALAILTPIGLSYFGLQQGHGNFFFGALPDLNIQYYDSTAGSFTITVGTYASATTYAVAVVEEGPTGILYAIKGGIYTSWTLLFVEHISSQTPIFATWGMRSNTLNSIDTFRSLKLGAPFNVIYGIVTQRLAGAVAQGTTFTHEADYIQEYVITTLPASSTIEVDIRRQDNSNRWTVSFTPSGTMNLYEIIAAVYNLRGTATGVAANGHRVVIIVEGPTIRGYSNNVLRWTYSSASGLSTNTQGAVNNLGTGGVVSDLITWPRVLPQAAAALLDEAFIVETLSFDDFNRADGPIGNGWEGATWTISGNKAINTPTLGAELLINGNFATWSGDNPTSWGIIGTETGTDKVTEVSGKARIVTTSAIIGISQTAVSALWYRIGLNVSAYVSGSLRVADSGYAVAVYSTTGAKVITGRVMDGSSTLGLLMYRHLAEATDITIDDVSVKALILSSLFVSINNGFARCDVSAKVTVVTANRAGVVTNLDSASSPANFVLASHDGTVARLTKCVAGTYTELIAIAVTYSAGAIIRVVRLAGTNTYQFWYNGAQVGTDQTISDAGIVNNTYHGLYSTYEGNNLDDFTIARVVY